MSIQTELKTLGITKEEFDCLIKLKKIMDKNGQAEIRMNKYGKMSVYEVKKRKIT